MIQKTQQLLMVGILMRILLISIWIDLTAYPELVLRVI